jgi:hypothetical protein
LNLNAYIRVILGKILEVIKVVEWEWNPEDEDDEEEDDDW